MGISRYFDFERIPCVEPRFSNQLSLDCYLLFKKEDLERKFKAPALADLRARVRAVDATEVELRVATLVEEVVAEAGEHAELCLDRVRVIVDRAAHGDPAYRRLRLVGSLQAVVAGSARALAATIQ